MKPLRLIKFLTSVKIKEETSYCREIDYKIELDDDMRFVRVESLRHKDIVTGLPLAATVPMHNVVYFWTQQEEPKESKPLKQKSAS